MKSLGGCFINQVGCFKEGAANTGLSVFESLIPEFVDSWKHDVYRPIQSLFSKGICYSMVILNCHYADEDRPLFPVVVKGNRAPDKHA